MTQENMALIDAAGIELGLGGRRILAHIDLRIAPGEIITLIGPNGAGKSSLVRVLLGLLRPDRGEIRRRAGLRIGYLPQKFAIDPVMPLGVERLMTLTCRASRTEIGAALAETGVAHLAGAQAQTLSGGELQRVLLARALLSNPELLVLDEPVQGVDFGGQAELYRLIGDIRARRGCAVLMVSHDLHLVMAQTDRVLCLNQHLCCAGTPAMVAKDPEYLRLFGPRAAEAFALYAHGPHGHDHVHTLSGDVAPLEPAHDH
ncbi:MAG: ATP-binding cassette domain-containing protein [Pseudomonadota bacterium]